MRTSQSRASEPIHQLQEYSSAISAKDWRYRARGRRTQVSHNQGYALSQHIGMLLGLNRGLHHELAQPAMSQPICTMLTSNFFFQTRDWDPRPSRRRPQMFPHGKWRLSWAHRQRCASYTQDQLRWVEASIGGHAQAVQVQAEWAGYLEGKHISCFMVVPRPETISVNLRCGQCWLKFPLRRRKTTSRLCSLNAFLFFVYFRFTCSRVVLSECQNNRLPALLGWQKTRHNAALICALMPNLRG